MLAMSKRLFWVGTIRDGEDCPELLRYPHPQLKESNIPKTKFKSRNENHVALYNQVRR